MFKMDLDKICFIVVKARQFDAKEDVVEPDYGSNAADDQMRQVLESYADDAVFDELKSVIDDLNVDEQVQLVALTWVGRGDFSKDEWDEAVKTAREAHNDHTAAYLLGTPLLPDYLEEGLATFDLSCQDFEMGHL
ncbi:MAG: DUF3775 domain-containing protein [Alphaproteobacteria bacterium]|nr:DUF3775 domain-containing protein [Alphaproteobacteria bacterium]